MNNQKFLRINKYAACAVILVLAALNVFQFFMYKNEYLVEPRAIANTDLIDSKEYAIDVATVNFIHQFGDRVNSKQPFLAKYNDGIWYVKGSLGSRIMIGGTPKIKIRAEDGAVLDVWHDK